jgi:hypothetical protein
MFETINQMVMVKSPLSYGFPMVFLCLSGIAAASRPPNAGAVDVQKHLRHLALGLVPLLPATQKAIPEEFTEFRSEISPRLLCILTMKPG